MVSALCFSVKTPQHARSCKFLWKEAVFYTLLLENEEQDGNYQKLLHSQLQHFIDMARRFSWARLRRLPDEDINCQLGDNSDWKSKDYFHSTDELTVPSHQQQLEQEIPLRSTMGVVFRDFKFVGPPHHSHNSHFASFVDTIEASMTHANITLPYRLRWKHKGVLALLERVRWRKDCPTAVVTVACTECAAT